MGHHETARVWGQSRIISRHINQPAVPELPSTGQATVSGSTMMEAAASQGRDWSSLPVYVLAQILSRIKWSSHPSFGLVCRRWQSARALSPFYPAWITPLLLNSANVGTTGFRYYSPYYHKNFEIDTKLEAPGAKIFCATGGRHLALGLLDKVLTADLGTGAVCKLPPVPRSKFDFAVYDGVGRMYGVKTIDGLVVIVSLQPDVATASGVSGSFFWDILPDGTAFTASPDCNPVLHDGFALHNGNRREPGCAQGGRDGRRPEILEKPHGFGLECEDSYLFESDQGELMAVLIGHRGTPVNVVKLNKHTMEWEKAESLQGRALFTGTLTTMMKRTNIKWMQDKVFLPRLFSWPETIHVDLVQRDNELAFVPKLGFTYPTMKDDNNGTNMWTYELGQGEEARAYWGTERPDHSI